MTYANPDILVSTDWLAEHLDDENLRVFDCTVNLSIGADGQYINESGRPAYDAGHIPGAGFLNLGDDLSDPDQALLYMLPSPDQFADVLGRAGRARQPGGSVQHWHARLGNSNMVDVAGFRLRQRRRA